ncbi:MAG: hypothetical protein IK127_00695 [Clostridia bacterium]|nr:hypothetical protein [Clostridia bacterium]
MIIRMILARFAYRFVRRVFRLMRLLRRAARLLLFVLLVAAGVLFAAGSALAAASEGSASVPGRVRVEIGLTTGRSGQFNLSPAVSKVRAIVSANGGTVLAVQDSNSVFVEIREDLLDALLKALEACGRVQRIPATEKEHPLYTCRVIVKITVNAGLYTNLQATRTTTTQTSRTTTSRSTGTRSGGGSGSRLGKVLGKGLGGGGSGASAAARGLRKKKKVSEEEKE